MRPDHVPAHQAAYGALSRRDGGLARLIALDGTPDPFVWGVLEDAGGRDAFAELALHIVSQQISTAAALTIFGRLRDKLSGEIEPCDRRSCTLIASPAPMSPSRRTRR